VYLARDKFAAVLETHAPPGATGLAVAVSGGADSAALLAVLRGYSFRGLNVRAVHVDHGLQSAAADLRQACVLLCGKLQVPLSILSVVVEALPGASIEEAARDARYAALSSDLHHHEILLTAHHREDQAESLLLQALRGAGIKGMSGMPVRRALGVGWHLRPLLDVSQRELLEFAASFKLPYVADPMNWDLRLDRVYLRREIWPLIKQRWPGAAGTLSRAAQHAADAQEFLDEAARVDFAMIRDGACLSLSRLRALTQSRQANVLRYWIRESGALPPATAQLSEGLRQVLEAATDHLPAIVWDGRAVRRYQDRVFLTPAAPARISSALAWGVGAPASLPLGEGLGALRWTSQSGGLDVEKLPTQVTVRGRLGGEAIRPGRGSSTQTLQHLCQARGIPPWMRDALPLVYAGEELLAVGDLWLNAHWRVAAGTPGRGINWEQAPNFS
jgi:tRNA(Ile)-lysidine synthase